MRLQVRNNSLVLSAILFLATLVVLPTMSADSVTFIPGTTGVGNSINSDGFFASADPSDLFGAHAYSYGGQLDAFGAGYSDAGIVLFLNGGLTLGQLESVAVDSLGSPLAVNLWLDSGNDGSIFTFDPSSFLLTGLAGDSYAGCGAPTLTTASSCFMLGGNGAGTSHTLAELQSGAVAGIDGNTRAALWIGVTNPGNSTQSAYVNSITVTTTSPVPEPASMMMFGTGLASIAGVVRRKLKK